MDFLRRILDTIKQQLGRLGPSERLLIGSFAVILILGLFLVNQLAAKSAYVPVMPGMSADDQQSAQTFLASSGIPVKPVNGQLAVPADQRDAALALLSVNRKLPADTSNYFQQIVGAQTWSNTRQQNDMIYNAGLKAELDRIISKMPGVKSASVMFEAPERAGLGAGARTPTASVAVFTESGAPLDQKMVDAIAAFVGGAKAGLKPAAIRVVDGSTGRQRKPTDDADVLSGTYLEHAAKVELDVQRKISEHLGYIPGVWVTVTAQVDVTRVKTQEERVLPVGEGSQSVPHTIQEDTSKQTDNARGAEAGVRSNATANINSGGGRGTSSETENNKKENDNRFGTLRSDKIDPRGMPTLVAVSVNVPRGFIASILKGPDGKNTPDDKAISDAFEKTYKPEIRASILPHVRALTAAAAATPDTIDSQVVVSLVPMDLAMTAVPGGQQAGVLGSITGGGSGGAIVLGLSMAQLIDKAVLGALALGALGFMFMMVRKSGKKDALPTAEEIVGIPPALDTKSDLIGEADESETPLAGIELGEGEVRNAKLLEQVTELVKTNPEGAASLIKRWISVDE